MLPCRRVVLTYFYMMYALHDLQYVNDVNPKELVKYGSSCGISKIQARIQKFFKEGGGVEEENLERKMFVDTRNNACLHKKLDKHATLSLFFSFQEDCLLFFAFIY